jgi:membrane associated rhomboid family serine protease
MRAMVAEHQYPADGLRRLVSYPFVHLSPGNLLFSATILLALGKFVGEAFRWWAVLAVFFLSTIAGALAYTWLLPWIRTPLIGAWVPIFGLIGALSFILWHRLRNDGPRRWRAFSMIGMLMLFKLLFSPLFGWGWDVVAELPAFVTGFLLSYAVSPGGAQRLVGAMRGRGEESGG